ncbi:MAG: hypothetical protein ACI308_11200 [Muribaculaceae bacterium]
MMNNNVDSQQQMPVSTQAQWGGYTIDELRYRRMVTLVKLESQKALLANRIKPVKKPASSKGVLGFTGSLIKRISGKMNIVDYLLIGYNISRFMLKLRKKRRR